MRIGKLVVAGFISSIVMGAFASTPANAGVAPSPTLPSECATTIDEGESPLAQWAICATGDDWFDDDFLPPIILVSITKNSLKKGSIEVNLYLGFSKMSHATKIKNERNNSLPKIVLSPVEVVATKNDVQKLLDLQDKMETAKNPIEQKRVIAEAARVPGFGSFIFKKLYCVY